MMFINEQLQIYVDFFYHIIRYLYGIKLGDNSKVAFL